MLLPVTIEMFGKKHEINLVPKVSCRKCYGRGQVGMVRPRPKADAEMLLCKCVIAQYRAARSSLAVQS